MSRQLFDDTFGQRNDTIIPRILGRPVSREECERFSQTKEAAYREVVGEKISPVPGAVELVRSLQERGVPCAVASSAPAENVHLILSSLRIERAMDATVSGSDVERGKPAPDVFLLAAARLGIRPERCVVVEDAPDGVSAARAADMSVVAVTSTRPAELLRGADIVVRDLRDLNARGLGRLVGVSIR